MLEAGDSCLEGFDFKGDPLSTDELRRHREKDLMTSLVKRDRDCVFREDLLVDHIYAANPNLIVLAGLSSTMEIFRFGAVTDLWRRWSQSILTASQLGFEAGWLWEKIPVSSGNCTK